MRTTAIAYSVIWLTIIGGWALTQDAGFWGFLVLLAFVGVLHAQRLYHRVIEPIERPEDAATGTELLKMNHASTVCGVAFSPDDARLATASNDNTARVWDAASGTELLKVWTTRAPSMGWRSVRTVLVWRPPATTTRRGCGTPPAAQNCSR